MFRKAIDFLGRLIFGKDFNNGYVKEPEEKDKYILMSIFPTEKMMEEAIKGYKMK